MVLVLVAVQAGRWWTRCASGGALSKFQETRTAITEAFFFSNYSEAFE
jgi:hypothetical protein